MTDRSSDPWLGSTYSGFTAAAVHQGRGSARRIPGRLIGVGVAAALVLGLGFGALTRSDIADKDTSPDRQMAAVMPARAVPVEVSAAPATPPPPPQAVLPMEVLPPDMARAAATRAAIPAPRPAPVKRSAPPEAANAAPAALVAAVPGAVRAPEPVVARHDPGFDCRYAGSMSERMVCGDAELARLDRRLNRAFDDAVAAGVPSRALRQDQDDWLRIREDAAREAGPRAVASVYRQRIAELGELARDASETY